MPQPAGLCGHACTGDLAQAFLVGSFYFTFSTLIFQTLLSLKNNGCSLCYLLWSWLLPLSVRLGRIPCQLLKNLSLSTFNDLSRKQLLGSCWWGLKDSEQSSTSVSFIESEQTVLPRSLPYLQPRGALRDSFHSRAEEKRATAPLCCMAKLRQESKGQAGFTLCRANRPPHASAFSWASKGLPGRCNQ